MTTRKDTLNDHGQLVVTPALHGDQRRVGGQVDADGITAFYTELGDVYRRQSHDAVHGTTPMAQERGEQRKVRAAEAPVPLWRRWTTTLLVFALATGGIWLLFADVDPRSWLGLLKVAVTITWFYLVLNFAAGRGWLVD